MIQKRPGVLPLAIARPMVRIAAGKRTIPKLFKEKSFGFAIIVDTFLYIIEIFLSLLPEGFELFLFKIGGIGEQIVKKRLFLEVRDSCVGEARKARDFVKVFFGLAVGRSWETGAIVDGHEAAVGNLAVDAEQRW